MGLPAKEEEVAARALLLPSERRIWPPWPAKGNATFVLSGDCSERSGAAEEESIIIIEVAVVVVVVKTAAPLPRCFAPSSTRLMEVNALSVLSVLPQRTLMRPQIMTAVASAAAAVATDRLRPRLVPAQAA